LKIIRFILFIQFLLILNLGLQSQNLSFFAPADSLHKPRFYTAVAFSGVAYTGFSIGLYNSWYKNFEREPFHLYNDWGEWRHMDKFGHIYSGYFQASLCYKGARWTGLSKNKSMWTGMIMSTVFQSTIEVMDGFSAKWGFSGYDVGANILGLTAFGIQQHLWDNQKIKLKMSSLPQSYAQNPIISESGLAQTSLEERTNQLFGDNYFESFLKDYNAQTYWASINVHDFLNTGNKWPQWLNIALGYGAQNMYGGYENNWEYLGERYVLDSNKFPRYSQFYLGFDVDMEKIKTKNHFFRTVLSVFNIFKIPSPALEVNTLGEIKFHILR